MPQRKELTNVTFDEIRIGQSSELTVTLTKTQIELLALVSGDVDTFHLKQQESSGMPGYGKRTEAAGAVALISAVIGSRLPGPGAKILRRELAQRGHRRGGCPHRHRDRAGKETGGQRRRLRHTLRQPVRPRAYLGHHLRGSTSPSARVRRHRASHIELRRGDSFMDLFKTCDTCAPVTCGVVHPCDRDSLMGAVEAARRDIVEPVFVGPEAKIRKAAEEAAIELGSWRIVPTPHSHASAAKAVELARAGEVESLMKGSLHTDEIMGAIVPSASGMRTSRRMSHALVMDVPTYHKMFMMTDAAVNVARPWPTRRTSPRTPSDLAHALGIERPKVGILSAVETVNASIPSTLDAAALCKMAERGRDRGASWTVPWPSTTPSAPRPHGSRRSGPRSAGTWTFCWRPIWSQPTCSSSSSPHLAGAEGAGIVLGTRIPVVLTSRADSVRSRLASAAVMAIVAQARREGKYEVR